MDPDALHLCSRVTAVHDRPFEHAVHSSACSLARATAGTWELSLPSVYFVSNPNILFCLLMKPNRNLKVKEQDS